ncbi:MAG TPA: PIG-L family deacetylase [Anaerolineales bacterium]|nr:PIG-L family deacetylase [Anaerolineales bacterium]
MKYDNKALLAVLAHPDDESFGMGGTLALYARKGVSVYLVCATRGEAGVVDDEYLQGYTSIAERRMAELHCAAEKLGLAGVYFLDYRDSGMTGSQDNQHPQALMAAPLEQVASEVASYIRQLRPQVVLTFDPVGGYKHPDHIAVHRATVRAFELAGLASFKDSLPPFKPAKLYYQVFPMGWLRFALKIMPFLGMNPRHFGRNRDIDLTALIEDSNFPVHAKIACRPVAIQRDEAFQCHASQLTGASLRRGPLRWLQYLLANNDYFMRAFPPASADLRERDIFEGLEQVP